MIHSLENKKRRELIEIVKIQFEEYTILYKHLVETQEKLNSIELAKQVELVKTLSSKVIALEKHIVQLTNRHKRFRESGAEK
jgi:hypothetical protein